MVFDAAVVAAFAAASVGIDGDVSEFTRDVGHAVIDLSVDDDAAATPRAERESDDVRRATRGSPPPFPVDRAVGVIVERRGEAQSLADTVAQRHVRPTKVWRQQHDARLGVERPWRADSDALDLLARFPHRGARQLYDATDHRVRALLGQGRLGDDADNFGAVFREGSGNEIGSADGNSDDVPHRPPRWLRRRPRDADRACSGDAPAGSSTARAKSRGGTEARQFPTPHRRPEAVQIRIRSASGQTARRPAYSWRSPNAAARCRS